MSEKIRVETKVITPKMAKAMLEKNTGNFRRLDKSRITRYAIDMKAGKWDLNGETIKLNCEDELVLDGQHRLHAVVESDTPVKMVIVHGVESAANIDIGRQRSPSDWFRHLGYKNSKAIAAISRLCIYHEKGFWSYVGVSASVTSNQEIVSFGTTNHEKIQDSIGLVYSKTKGISSQSAMAAVMFIGAGIKFASENELCCWFTEALSSGESLKGDEPALLLRNRLLLNNESTAKISPHLERMLLTLAWNKTVKGESMKNLRLVLSGPNKQEPPNVVEIAK